MTMGALEKIWFERHIVSIFPSLLANRHTHNCLIQTFVYFAVSYLYIFTEKMAAVSDPGSASYSQE